MNTIPKIFEDLTFENLREWAGEKIYHRGEEYVDRIYQAEDGQSTLEVQLKDETVWLN